LKTSGEKEASPGGFNWTPRRMLVIPSESEGPHQS